MASNGATTQALLGAFTFGSVVYAASAALALYINGHGSAVFRDSQRLVLIFFLICSALWAVVDFITTLIDTTGRTMPCQIAVIFASIFDQLARFSIEQFLLWAMNSNKGGKASVAKLIPQIVVLLRFVAGAVFVGFTRPQTDDFCVATTSGLPVGVAVVVLDAVIIVLLIQKLYSGGAAAKANGKPLTSVLLGLVCWTVSSIVMLLGIQTIPPAARTALPAGGLLVLISCVTAGAWTLVGSKKSEPGHPEAPSPRRINISRDISTADSEYPPSRYEDLKEANIRSSRSFTNPRMVPRVKDESSIGFPFVLDPTQGEPIPPLPATTMPTSDLVRKLERQATGKWGMRDMGKGAGGGRLVIGQPVLQNDEDKNPLNKIATVGLREAAMAERERRAKTQGESDAAAINHAAVQSMGMSHEEALKRAASVKSLKRKEVGSMISRQSYLPGTLQPEPTASTTSAQLSPRGDEPRRRSPRVPEPAEERPWSPDKMTALVRNESVSSTNSTRPVTVLQTTVPQPIQRPEIRPSRMLPPSPDASPQPEAAKTPLQRRPTIGLPTNPRARGIQVAQEAAAGSQHKTIMFVNNIEYHDPIGVESIIQDAKAQPRNTKAVANPETPGTSASVVNRPRPIPRNPSPSHRRSKSGGSLMGRKSILNSTPGSPTQLPPLPPAPVASGLPSRPHPNDTKSMTFDEKMTLLFPSPGSAKATNRRSSSVPDLPQIPKSYLDTSSTSSESDSQRRSNRTTKTSVRTDSVLEVDEIPQKPTVLNTSNEAARTWMRAFDGGKQQSAEKRKSSPVLPQSRVRASAWTETTVDDATTNWSAMNTPEIAIGMPVMPAMGLPAPVRMPARQVTAPKQENRDSDTVPFMLDTSMTEQVDNRKSWLQDDEEEPVLLKPTRFSQSQWHRRVGDECPAFSECMEKGSRKTPPTPLTLNAPGKKAIVIQTEPSPLESPEHALRQIQAQLKKLEEPQASATETPSKRLALLENLEKEMGMQVDHWKEMKHDLGRDSLSSLQTSSPTAKRESLASVASTVIESSNRSSIGADRRASRLARVVRNNSTRTVPVESSVRNSASPQMSKWQKRLTEAQMEYMDARLLRESSVNFLQLSRAQIASPTPPDSDESSVVDEEEVPPIPVQYIKEAAPITPPAVPAASLWSPAKRSSAPAGLLWTPAPKTAPQPEAPLVCMSVRPAPRKELAPLQIESTQLWRKPYENTGRSSTGLWRPVWASAAPPANPARRSSQAAPSSQPQKAPRPLTQRPPRRNKRVTLLPDILENPEPLPDKRGTLGIFQFPWGEKSDTAAVQPRSSVLMAMPGTMSSGAPKAAKQSELTEYSSSFFDDYDDEDEIDGLNSEDEGSNDGFDETTLWEIASLLKVDNVPSRDSLIGDSTRSSVTSNYMEELESDGEGQEQSIVIGLGEPQELIHDQSRDSATLESSDLVMLGNAAYEPEKPLKVEHVKPTPKPVARIGLPANPKASLANRSAPLPPAAESLRSAPPASKRIQTALKQGSAGLWNRPVTGDHKSSSQGGLFAVDSTRSEYRTTSEEPAAQYMSRKPRPAELKPLDKLTSTDLWTAHKAAKRSSHIWIQGAPKAKKARLSDITVQIKPRALFEIDPERTEFRTTSEEPAAQYMARKPRTAELKPLDQLKSTNLWTAETNAKRSEHSWIHGAPKAKKARLSDITVQIKPKRLFEIDLERSEFRTTSEEPAAQYMTRKPRAAELKPLDQLKSTNLWAASTKAKIEPNWIQEVPKSKKASSNKVFIPVCSPTAWQAALKEAVSASYPQPRRISATAADWDAALEEAIALSCPQSPTPEFDSAVCHPVFAAKSLVTRSPEFHPAATGYTYDVANVHPVFFGSLAITCPLESVHPAISSYAAKKLRRHRSKRSTEPGHVRSRSRSASHSRKDEIRALIRTIEEEGEYVVPVPAIPRRDAIQAQIEALEQERMFVQQAAQAEYLRRTSMLNHYVPEPVLPEPEPIVETVQDIQRRLSQRIRESLIISRPSSATTTPVATPTRARSKSIKITKAAPPLPTTTTTTTVAKPPATLWTPPVKKAVVAAPTGLWTDQADHSVASPPAEEDSDAAARRAHGRKTIQKKARRAEILAQIAAVKAGLNPFTTFEGMSLWTAPSPVVPEIDWLHTVNRPVVVPRRKRSSASKHHHHHHERTESRGVILRY
ncbi:hypothetical protein QBC35DRAFT_55243 [Podospora australis]|uniref:Uncharacterized protein n=1 Tax=Podospora australis TaxID=1536484 RepID=A0AAN6X011_9PEZI|nr:hypothetical protein QBC35DRAFT_55243 [Podospora australis]